MHTSHIWRKDRVPKVLTASSGLCAHSIEIRGVDDDVIYIDHQELVEILTEDIIHHVLEYGRVLVCPNGMT